MVYLWVTLIPVSRKLTLYLSPLKMLSCPMAISNRLRAAMRGGFLSSFSELGAGTCNSLEPNCDTGHGFGKACVGVARSDPQNNPASNSWSAVSGTPNESVMAIAGAPVESVVVCAQFPPKHGVCPATSPLSYRQLKPNQGPVF